jgi:NifU-like protein
MNKIKEFKVARKDLIGGNVWEQYSQKVQERMNNPKALGELTETDAKTKNARLIVADFGAESCGDAVRLFWLVNKYDQIIESKFKSFGCGTAIASSDAMAELCIGKTVDEAMKINNLDVEFFLRDEPNIPSVPPQKMHCSVMAYDVILEAVAQYKGVDRDTLKDKEIVCECARVSLGTLVQKIKDLNLHSVEEVVKQTKIGSYCKSCQQPGGHEKMDVYIVDVISDVWKDKLKEKTEDVFGKLTLVSKIRKLEDFMDREIRPSLMLDGGNVELVDIKQNDELTTVFLKYLGACSSCMSSTSTYFGIENLLKSKLDENIKVVMV